MRYNDDMKYELKDKVVLITGGAMGLGKDLVEQAAQKGAKVVFCDIADMQGKQLELQLIASGYDALYYHCNVADYTQVEEMFDFIMEKYGKIQVLINNAAKQTVASIEKMGYEEFKSVIDVNLNGAFYCMKNAAKHMVEHSVIMNILSIYWSERAREDKYHYDAAKAGLGSLTRNFAKALGRKGISVNGIYPGFLMTPMNGEIQGEELEKSLAKNKLAHTDASTSAGFAEYVLSYIEYFSHGVTGQVIGVDAGRTL